MSLLTGVLQKRSAEALFGQGYPTVACMLGGFWASSKSYFAAILGLGREQPRPGERFEFPMQLWRSSAATDDEAGRSDVQLLWMCNCCDRAALEVRSARAGGA